MKYLSQKIRETIKRAVSGDAVAAQEAQRILEADFSYDERHKALYATLRQMREHEDCYVWRHIRDVYDTWLVYEEYTSGIEHLYRADYTISDAGVATISNPQKVKIAYELLPDPSGTLGAQESDSSKSALRRAMRETVITPELAGRVARESAIREDGTILIRIIGPKQNADGSYPNIVEGSSGNYPFDVLKRDIPKIFPAGTKMFANHLSAEEEITQPEGRIEFLAAETTTNPFWMDQGPVGPGSYTYAKPFADWAPMLDDKASALGTSIYAWGAGDEDATGVVTFTQLTEGRSIDFVTFDGAGGKIVPIKEARRFQEAKGFATVKEGSAKEGAAPGEALTTPPTPNTQENTVNEQEAQVLRETAGRVPALETQVGTLTTEKAALEAEIGRLKEAAIINQARGVANDVLADIEMPDMTRTRVAEAQAKKPVLKDGADGSRCLDTEAFKTQVTEAATAELEYLQQSTGYGTGKVQGNGSTVKESDEPKPEEIELQLTEAFRDLGLSEGEARVAATGR